MWVTATNLAPDPRLWNTACRIVQSYSGAVWNVSSGLAYKGVNKGIPIALISCMGGLPALFTFSVNAPPFLFFSLSRLRECYVWRATPREHTLLVCCPNVQGGADWIAVFQAIGPFIKRQAVSIYLIAPRVWKGFPCSVDISSMRCLQAINVCF